MGNTCEADVLDLITRVFQPPAQKNATDRPLLPRLRAHYYTALPRLMVGFFSETTEIDVKTCELTPRLTDRKGDHDLL